MTYRSSELWKPLLQFFSVLFDILLWHHFVDIKKKICKNVTSKFYM